ncbi:MAG: M23 family metallopeptidase [Desulfobacteraceae bacterium]|nr:M23 family metallopeptidase [Desulfobacteraceae bacterium]
MYYTRAQYRAYISSLRQGRRRKGMRPFSFGFFVLLIAMAGAYLMLQESSASLTNTFETRQISRQQDLSRVDGTDIFWKKPFANPAARSAWEQGFGSLLQEKTYTVNRGDTLINILLRADLAAPEAYSIVRTLENVFDPATLKTGHELRIGFIDNEYSGPVFQRLRLKTGFDREYQVMRGGDQGYCARQIECEIRTRPARVEAEINSSLYRAAREADLPIETLMQVLRAYSYDVDFQRDIQPGDRIEILYEEKVDEDGKLVATGNVLFAALHTNGRALRIYRYKTANGGTGFYDAKGESVRKALMVTPIEGASVSSGYGMRRHPILGYNKMHEGLDFAARTGTPIMAAGDGVVEYAGRRGSYGKYIRIRHPNNYKTIYAHLSGYAGNIKSGTRVDQGQTIGYAGSTGRSTGPHLHYEVLYAGSPINPSKMDTKPGRTLEGEELQRFMLAKAELEELYASLKEDTKLAAASDNDSQEAEETAMR